MKLLENTLKYATKTSLSNKMFKSLLNGLSVKRLVTTTYNQIRAFYPVIRMDADYFEIILDVRPFTIDELRVKAHPDYVVIEGKQERQINDGFLMRKFSRKFKLPPLCHVLQMESTLTPEGVLKISVCRYPDVPNSGLSFVRNVPIECRCPSESKDSKDDEGNPSPYPGCSPPS